MAAADQSSQVAAAAAVAGGAKDEAPCSAPTPAPPKPAPVAPDEMRAVARKFADQPVQNSETGVWAVLTAISKNARLRPQGMNLLLSADEHCLGRCVEDPRFQIAALSISGNHCKIYRDMVLGELSREEPVPVFLKDTSTNGTFINWKKLRKSSSPVKLNHGDIISLSTPPNDDNSYAFVYREVHAVTCTGNGSAALKRKSDEVGSESKRLKGLGIGSPDGPVSLDDVRSLQKSNTELRQQVESHVLTIETLKSENRAALAQHENELKELKERTSSSYLEQIKDLQQVLDGKQKEIDSLNMSSMELQNSMKDLNESFTALKQSRADADEIVQSQNAMISEIEGQLVEERNMRREEREKAAEDLKSALQKVQAEAQEEIKKHADAYLRQHKEQQEVISKLQESEKETRLLVETLRSKLADTRESLVTSEKKVRQLEAQVQDEQLVSANSRKKSDSLESELRKLKNELDNEKAAREEAWAKVAGLELEIAAVLRDLSIERQRVQGAKERIILRETQLRAFYSTTEEISALFAKQQEQLKAMQRTLEDEENYENTLMGFDLNKTPLVNLTADNACGKEVAYSKNTIEASGASTENTQASGHSSSDEDAHVTEKQNAGARIEDDNTQDLECTSPGRSVKGFGSDIEGSCAAPAPEREPTETERVLETESQAGHTVCVDQNAALRRCSNPRGESMQLDDEAQHRENEEPVVTLEGGIGGCPEAKQDNSQTRTIRTADLLASEVAGSWAVDTAPSVNGENDFPENLEDAVSEGAGRLDENVASTAAAATAAAAAPVSSDDVQAAESQTNVDRVVSTRTDEHRVLNAMIEIVAPEFRRQLSGGGGGKDDSMSDAETAEGSEESEAGSESDGNSHSVEDGTEAMAEDSVG